MFLLCTKDSQQHRRKSLIGSFFDLHHILPRAMEGAMGNYYHGFAREHIVVSSSLCDVS